MKNLKIYYIDSSYINYLRKFDKNVAYNKNSTRPYIGIVYTYNNYNYFAPLSSPKPKHIDINPKAIDIFKIKDGELGVVNINNMIPTKMSELTEALPIITDDKYKKLLQEQLTYLNNHKAELMKKINYFQNMYRKQHLNENILKRCCNFTLLEERFLNYMRDILFFEPVYKDYIWGGTRLKEYFNKKVTMPTVAESWEISTNEAGLSTISNEDMQGVTLKELFDNKDIRSEIFGTKTETMDKFPLLIKYIDANSNLSVQVHPNDEYAKKYENDTGKTEMWYVIDCKENAQIICGMKDGVKEEDVEDIIRSGKIKENLKYMDIQKQDVIYIPSGTVHAILGNTLICEIQQNSNLTYRVYDWDRVGSDGKPRELHIDKAIDVINVNAKPYIQHTNKDENEKIVDNEFFKVEKIVIDGEYKDISNKETFYAMNVIEGVGKIEANNKEYSLNKGDSFLIPANLGEYKITGKMKILKSYCGGIKFI